MMRKRKEKTRKLWGIHPLRSVSHHNLVQNTPPAYLILQNATFRVNPNIQCVLKLPLKRTAHPSPRPPFPRAPHLRSKTLRVCGDQKRQILPKYGVSSPVQKAATLNFLIFLVLPFVSNPTQFHYFWGTRGRRNGSGGGQE